jgi:hypothetical protein
MYGRRGGESRNFNIGIGGLRYGGGFWTEDKLMKTLAAFILFALTAQAASISLDITKLTALKGDSKLHKFVYLAETLAAAASLGADGYSTEVAVVQTPNSLRAHGYPCNPCIAESNALFLQNGTGQFSQLKFWGYKGGLAISPFVLTWALHHWRDDSTSTDVASIIGASGLTALFTTAAIKNLDLAKRTVDANHANYPQVGH